MTFPEPERLFFCLGGHDLEMAAIRDLLAAQAPGRFADRRLSWGAKASAYYQEIAAASAGGLTSVLVELDNDLGGESPNIIEVDHHGPRAGANQPTALEQVFQLLRQPVGSWTRWQALVSANDRGHIHALRRLGASEEEIRAVRRADQEAQGVTEAERHAAQEAVLARTELPWLTVIHLPHNRSSLVADYMDPAFGGPGAGNLLVVAPDEYAFQGRGAVVRALDAAFPGGWCGGELPQRGYWGCLRRVAQEAAVIKFAQAAGGER